MDGAEEAAKAVNKAELGRIINRMNTKDIAEVLGKHFNGLGLYELVQYLHKQED